MKIENEAELDEYILCHRCHTLHKEVPIKDGEKAYCQECHALLYIQDDHLLEHGLALSMTALLFFVVASLFPLVKIEILGHMQYLTLPKTFMVLFENGFYIVGLFCLFLIFIFPMMVVGLYMAIFTLLNLGKCGVLLKDLLILLAHIRPWSMAEIFLISIFVSLVKLIGYAQIHMGISFGALLLFVMLDLYLGYKVRMRTLWKLRAKCLNNQGEKRAD